MTGGLQVAAQVLRSRRRGLLGWCLGVAALMGFVVAAYPSVRNAGTVFDQYLQQMPETLIDAFGLRDTSLSSPPGYLVSQLYSNVYVATLLVMGIGWAAWAIAGSEADGTLEVLLANPVSRVAVALGRVAGIGVALVVVNLVAHVILLASSPAVQLGAGMAWWAIPAVAVVSLAFTFVHAAVTFAAGAATGRRGLAIGMGAGLALVGFLVNAMAGVATPLHTARNFSPWYWLLRDNPLTTAPDLVSLGLPLGLSVVLVGAGTWVFHRRDLAG